VYLDIWTAWDPGPHDTDEQKARSRKRLQQAQSDIRTMLPRLAQEIENTERDLNSVGEVLRPYHRYMREAPMTPDDLPEIEALCRRVLELGGLRQSQIQEVLLRLVGATAAPQSIPFLLDMWRYSRRGDNFGPDRRRLALWALARIALFHNEAQVCATLLEGLDDHRADVRLTAADLILDAYLSAQREVPSKVVDKLRQMAQSDPDDDVQRTMKKFLREPWAKDQGI
jgi:hypothetical protein